MPVPVIVVAIVAVVAVGIGKYVKSKAGLKKACDMCCTL